MINVTYKAPSNYKLSNSAICRIGVAAFNISTERRKTMYHDVIANLHYIDSI